ncbi:MAG TPA: CHAT domain-containing protein [Thermoanaerobaculia bacterium]|nr:CHAT domain-containing protein [Thermoanaerobaculia bacterium]
MLQLLSGDPHGAVALLRRALQDGQRSVDVETATDAGLLTDLAAASYEEAVQENRPADLVTASSAAGRAIELAPHEPSAWYVYALVLEALHLREDAIEAWRSYLVCDSGSGWAREAHQHLVSLQQGATKSVRKALLNAATRGDTATVAALAKAAPQQARIAAEEELLGDWGADVLASDEPRALASLRQAALIADAICRGSGDCTTIDATAVAQHGDVQTVARAYTSYTEARAAYGHARDAKARDELVQSAYLLEGAGSPLSARAWVYAATITHYLGGNDQALAFIDRALGTLKGRESRNPLAIGEALWTRGLIDFARGLPHQSLLSYNSARPHLLQAGEQSDIAGIEAVLAETYRYIGDPESAWNHHLLTLQALAGDATYTRRQVAFSDIAKAATDSHQFRFASLIARRMLQRAEGEHDGAFESVALYAMARIDIARQRSSAARDELERAAALLDPIKPNGTTVRLIADIAIARGEILTNDDPASAVEFLADASNRLIALDHRSRLPSLHLLAARARTKLKEPAEAEHELRAGVQELERQRGNLVDDEERSTFTDTGRALYDDLVQLLASDNRDGEALQLIRRARTLGLMSSDPIVRTADVERPAASSISNGTLIEYYVLPHALLTWRTMRGSTRLFETAVERDQLDAMVSRNVAAIRKCLHPEDCTAAGAALYDMLVRGPFDSLPNDQEVVIAPDGPLHRVPFAALYDNLAHQYVVERHQVTIALGGNTAAPLERPYRSILVAAASDPGGDFQPLTSVVSEGERAARQFRESRILRGPEATADRLLESAGKFEVVHFAGHGEANERQPRMATLRCASTTSRADGALYAWEISARRFPKTRLIVLAACDTARGRLVGTGLLGFARRFIAAGVPRVVGSLWDVEDHASAELFSHFYGALSTGASSASALRQAQRAAIASHEFSGPATWATFQLYTSW